MTPLLIPSQYDDNAPFFGLDRDGPAVRLLGDREGGLHIEDCYAGSSDDAL